MADTQLQMTSLGQIAGVVIDRDTVRSISRLADADALVLLGCCAEDPANWHDIVLAWPRYSVGPDNAGRADELSCHEMDLSQAVDTLADADAWCALDLVDKRLFTGGRFEPLYLDGTPRGDEDSLGETIVLPPWWQLHQQVDTVALRSARIEPSSVPNPHREVLWGPAMTRFFAARMIDAIRAGKQWKDVDSEGTLHGHYDLTVAIPAACSTWRSCSPKSSEQCRRTMPSMQTSTR